MVVGRKLRSVAENARIPVNCIFVSKMRKVRLTLIEGSSPIDDRDVTIAIVAVSYTIM